MRSFTLALASAFLLAFTGSAAAQLPPAPTPIYTVEIQNTGASFPALVANGSGSVPFTVVLTLGNVVCAAPVTIPVTLTATVAGAPSFFTVLPEPAVLNFTIAQGPHGSGAAAPAGGGVGDSAVVARIAGDITSNASIQVTLQASAPAPAGAPGGCSGASPIGAATSAPVTVFANVTETPQPPPAEPTPEETPGPGVAALIVAAGAALVLRRKKG